MGIFNIRNVGTNHGDCFFIEIANEIWKSVIMVDGRKGDTESLEEIKEAVLEYEKIDYLVITHIDEDHLNGARKLLREDSLVKTIFERTVIIYNYVTKPVISYRQAEEFEELLLNYSVISTIQKNYIPYSSPCLKIISSEKRRELDPREQENAAYAVMTLIHPQKNGIEAVYADYMKYCNRKGKPDSELINRQSIVFLLEYQDKCALFTGDCEIEDVADEIEQLKNMRDEKGNYRRIDVIKIPHHGAIKNNKGLAAFAQKHQCRKYLVTGNREWDNKHPSHELMTDIAKSVGGKIQVYTNVRITFSEEENVKIEDKNELKLMGEE